MCDGSRWTAPTPARSACTRRRQTLARYNRESPESRPEPPAGRLPRQGPRHGPGVGSVGRRRGRRELGRGQRRVALSRRPWPCSASTSTFLSARRSATTATSIAVCSTRRVKAQYVEALVSEIRRAGRRRTPVDTIYFGGGTPSLLDAAEVAAHPRRVPRQLRTSPPTPRSRSKPTRRASPPAARRLPRRRRQPAELRRAVVPRRRARAARPAALARRAPAEAVALARAAGFDNVSLDLMMWLPGQTSAQWLESVDRADRASAPSTPRSTCSRSIRTRRCATRWRAAGWSLAPDDDAADMYLRGAGRARGGRLSSSTRSRTSPARAAERGTT